MWILNSLVKTIFKVLDLQSRYKSDKRFVLDERFIEDGESDEDEKSDKDKDERESKEEKSEDDDRIELNEVDAKTKQLNILQDVLGIAIKTKPVQSESRKTKYV